MKKPLSLTLLAAMISLPACADCKHEAERSLSQDLDGIERVVLKVGAGDLEIAAGGSSLQANGTACASRASDLDDMQLVASRDGSTLRIETEVPDTSGWRQARIDVSVELPASLPIAVTDGSGDMRVEGVTLDGLKDGSGDIRLTQTRGSFRITDGSGGVKISEHRGDLELKDGSGDLRIDDIEGDVTVLSDGSGDIDIEQVSGSVEIASDGSGDIVVDTVGGDLRVGSAGSGDVRYRDISGRIEVPRKD